MGTDSDGLWVKLQGSGDSLHGLSTHKGILINGITKEGEGKAEKHYACMIRSLISEKFSVCCVLFIVFLRQLGEFNSFKITTSKIIIITNIL